ncbi:MAG: response regulator transcription factor [Acidobacteriota bacterium]
MKPVRILIADDHEIVRRGLRALLETRPDWEIAGEAVTGLQAVKEAERLAPDLVIMDLSMPDMNGLEATRQIRELVPRAQILILSVHDSEQLVREVLEVGARGYVLKSDAGRDLTAAVEALCQHKLFFSPKVSEMVVEGFLKGGGTDQPKDPLTARERQIVQLLAEGKSNKEIAPLLNISVKTVETHRSHVMAKLNLHSMSDLVRYALRNRLVQP